MERSRRALSISLTLVGTASVCVAVLFLAMWLIGLLDHVATGERHDALTTYLAIGLSALVLAIALRAVYRRLCGVASETADWLRQR